MTYQPARLKIRSKGLIPRAYVPRNSANCFSYFRLCLPFWLVNMSNPGAEGPEKANKKITRHVILRKSRHLPCHGSSLDPSLQVVHEICGSCISNSLINISFIPF